MPGKERNKRVREGRKKGGGKGRGRQVYTFQQELPCQNENSPLSSVTTMAQQKTTKPCR